MPWVLRSVDPVKKSLLSLKYGISPITASVLINRGIEEENDVESFLFPTLDKLHDPYMMKGVSEGVERLRLASLRGEKVLVYGDYDVDGVTGTALFLLAFKEAFGDRISYFIPHRVKEGYGLHSDIVRYARDKGFSLIVTIDCGISSIDVVEEGKRLGLDFIITDHHIPGERLPDGAIIINPKQRGCNYPFKELSGVGLAWKLASAFVGRPLIELLDLVALGTIADIVPLRGENRILVREGLKLLNPPIRLGIRELLKESGVRLSRRIDEWVISFILAPRLNAAGRMDIADLSVSLLLTQSPSRAKELSRRLNLLNSRRKSVEGRILSEAEGHIRDLPLVFLCEEGWHIGVLGIVASKLVEKHGRPTFLMCRKDGKVKGSARGVEGFNVSEALSYCSEFLEAYGGHEMAGGFSLREENLFKFREKLLEFVQGKAPSLEETLWIDDRLEVGDLTNKLAFELSSLYPWGKGNPRPVLLLEDVIIQKVNSGSDRVFKAMKDGFLFDVFSLDGELSLKDGGRVSLLGFWGVDSFTGMPCFRVEALLNGGDLA